MKKITSSVLLSTLLLPSLLLAEEPAQITTTSVPVRAMRLEGSSRPVMTGQRMPLAASSTLMMRKGERGERPEGRASSTSGLSFCQDIDKVLTYLDTKAVQLEEKADHKDENNATKKDEMRDRIDAKRTENDSKKKIQLDELSKRATTDTQKQALLSFQKTMTEAMATQKAAADSILMAHRTEVDTINTARKADREKALATLKSAIEQAKARAKSDCSSGVSSDQVRNNLKSAMEKAEETFRASIQATTKVKDITEADKEVRKAELQKAEDAFRTSMEKAKMDLKNALRKATTTPSPAQ